MGKREARKIIGPTVLDIQGIYSDVIIVDSLHHSPLEVMPMITQCSMC